MVLKAHPRRWSVCMGFGEVGFRGSTAWCGRLRGQPRSHRFRIEVMEDKTFQVRITEQQEPRGQVETW